MVPHDAIAPAFSNAPNAHRADRPELKRYRGFDLYAGHYGFDAYRRLSGGHLLFTNFRDPVRRIYSMYRYWRNNIVLDDLTDAHPSDVAVVKLAHDLSFSEFVRANNSDLRLYIRNFHFRQLHSSGWHDIQVGWRAKWVVKRRIAAMPWFFIAETPEASALLLERIIPKAANMKVGRHNASLGHPDVIDAADAEYLTRLNVFDYAIYAFALELQEQRLSS